MYQIHENVNIKINFFKRNFVTFMPDVQYRCNCTTAQANTFQKICSLVVRDPLNADGTYFTQRHLSKLLRVSTRTVKRTLDYFQSLNLLTYGHAGKLGTWIRLNMMAVKKLWETMLPLSEILADENSFIFDTSIDPSETSIHKGLSGQNVHLTYKRVIKEINTDNTSYMRAGDPPPDAIENDVIDNDFVDRRNALNAGHRNTEQPNTAATEVSPSIIETTVTEASRQEGCSRQGPTRLPPARLLPEHTDACRLVESPANVADTSVREATSNPLPEMLGIYNQNVTAAAPDDPGYQKLNWFISRMWRAAYTSKFDSGMQAWREFCERIGQSPFLKKRAMSRSWKDFIWLFKFGTIDKIQNGELGWDGDVERERKEAQAVQDAQEKAYAEEQARITREKMEEEIRIANLPPPPDIPVEMLEAQPILAQMREVMGAQEFRKLWQHFKVKRAPGDVWYDWVVIGDTEGYRYELQSYEHKLGYIANFDYVSKEGLKYRAYRWDDSELHKEPPKVREPKVTEGIGMPLQWSSSSLDEVVPPVVTRQEDTQLGARLMSLHRMLKAGRV